MKDTI